MDLLGKVGEEARVALDLAIERQRVIAANIANVNTPGYRAQELKFDRTLKAVLSDREGVNPREDGNTVVVEIETAEMRKNALVYRLFVQALAHETRLMRAAISGRTS